MSDHNQDLPPDRFASIFADFIREVASAAKRVHPLLDRITEHLGTDPSQLPVTAQQLDTFDAPNLQLAIEAYLKERDDRRAELIGVNVENKRWMGTGLSEMVIPREYGPALSEGPVDFVNYQLAGDRVMACVNHGLYLVHSGSARIVALVLGPSELAGDPRRQRLHLEVMSSNPEEAPKFIAEVMDLANKLNVYRGQTIMLTPGMYMGPGPTTLVQFQNVPVVVRDQVVLPPGLLERIERHTIVFSEHADELRAGGRSLKRGVLLFGLPGTGKTLTLMYLIGRMPGRTVILMTGRGLMLIESVAKLARQLAPSMVVMEDVDLVAEERTTPGFRGAPFLFELLNEMDGLRDDQDVIFALTTNRADILEPALAARPGRIDLAVELPLPDADGRRRLMDLYARGLRLEEVDLQPVVDRTEGASPAYIKEMLRKAALNALESGDGTTLKQEHFDAALDELSQGGRLAERILGFRPEAGGPETSPPGTPGWRPTGFPPQASFRRRS